VWLQKNIYTHPVDVCHHWGGDGAFSNAKTVKGQYETKLESPEVVGWGL